MAMLSPGGGTNGRPRTDWHDDKKAAQTEAISQPQVAYPFRILVGPQILPQEAEAQLLEPVGLPRILGEGK